MADPIMRARDANGDIIEIYAYKGDDGRGITDASINANGELVLEFSDGTSTNLGIVVGDGAGTGATITNIAYDATAQKWIITYDNAGSISENSIDGPIIPSKVDDLSDGNEYCKKGYVDEMFDDYITQVAALIGGNA